MECARVCLALLVTCVMHALSVITGMGLAIVSLVIVTVLGL